MSAADDPGGAVDEFDQIARLFRPLAVGAPEALGLMDDAAVIPSRVGFDLVVTTDTLVEGVHFLGQDLMDLVARKLLRVNLSDLAAKAAEPYGYFLNTAWSPRCGWTERTAFAKGLGEDQARFGLRLMGGDTTATPGPLTLSLTALGWVRAGSMVRRGGARAGDLLLVSGTIGDGGLGLQVLTGAATGLDEAQAQAVANRYRLPEPRLALRGALARHAAAAADVSDGLLADAGRLGEASGCAVTVDLDRVPLSPAAAAWAAGQGPRAEALAWLAAAGDDYEIVCAAAPEEAQALIRAAQAVGVAMTVVGAMTAGSGVRAQFEGRDQAITRQGYRHR